MGSSLLHVGAVVQCPHVGQVNATTKNRQVKVGGQFVVTIQDTFTIAGCPFQVPAGVTTKPQPCVKVQWIKSATRVRVKGKFVLLQDSQGICQSAEQIPQGPPSVKTVQIRVKGV
jgi:hypothetical protein